MEGMVLVDASLERLTFEVPENLLSSPEAAKEYIWKNHADEIVKNISLKSTDTASTRISCSSLTRERFDKRLLLLEKVAHIQRQYLHSEQDMKLVFGRVLEDLLEFMGCEYGFIGELKQEDDGTPYVLTHAATNIAWNEETQKFVEENEARGGLRFYAFNNLFGLCVTTGEPVISNDRCNDPRSGGIPPGHPPLNQFLGLPFLGKDGQVLGMVAMANPQSGQFLETDIETLEPFTVTCANLIEAHWQIEENRFLIGALERKVQQRTLDLQKANADLKKAHETVVAASQARLRHFACITHEIRTPLNCILGLSGLLLESDLDEGQRESLQMIVNSGDLLLTVVNDVLDYSKLETGNVEIEYAPFNLQTTLSSVVRSIEMKGRQKNLKIHCNFSSNVPEVVTTDGRRLQQVLYNLLGNALKFSFDDSVIELNVSVINQSQKSNKKSPTRTVEAFANSTDTLPTTETTLSGSKNEESSLSLGGSSSCPFQQGNLDVSKVPQCPFGFAPDEPCTDASEKKPETESSWLRFVVKDYGRGIAGDELDLIFEPFHQAESQMEHSFGGTGLGLAICSKISEALGGTIGVTSSYGEFSEFTLEIPFHGRCVPLPDLSGAWVIVVDSDRSNCEKVESIADACGAISFSSPNLRCLLSCIPEAQLKNSETLLVINEAEFDETLYCELVELSKPSLITFGEKYMVKRGQKHLVSLKDKIPCVLANELSKGFSRSDNSGGIENIAKPVSRWHLHENRSFYRNANILIAEDNVVNQKVLIRILKRLGVENVTVVQNGKEAIDEEQNQKYDVVLMDYEMPVLNGVEACKHILARRPDAPPVVFVTAHVFPSFHQECAAAGAFSFISKPYSLKDIDDMLFTVCTRGTVG